MARKEITLADDEREALNALVPAEQQTGDAVEDLRAAIRESWRRREENTRLGATVLAALYRSVSSWRIVEFLTDIPRETARRWATPPRNADADRPANTDD